MATTRKRKRPTKVDPKAKRQRAAAVGGGSRPTPKSIQAKRPTLTKAKPKTPRTPARTPAKAKPKAKAQPRPGARPLPVKTKRAPGSKPRGVARPAVTGYGKAKPARKLPPVQKPTRKPAKPIAKRKPIPVARPANRKQLLGGSHHPEAIRSRKRRQAAALPKNPKARAQLKRRLELQAIADAKRIEAEAKRERRRIKDAERRRRAAGQPKPSRDREKAEAWLEYIRNRIASVHGVSLEIVARAGLDAREPWLAVGRFDFMTPVGYAEFGEVLRMIRDDLPLEVVIKPERVTQIRVLYHDPNDRRGEGDRYISQIGPWSFVLGDLIGDITDSGPDSLAVRYESTLITSWFLYLSATIEGFATIGGSPWVATSGKGK